MFSFPLNLAGFILDLKGRVTFWSDACARLTGYSRCQMQGSGDAWKSFYNTPQPLPAEMLLHGDLPCLAKCYGSSMLSYAQNTAFSGFIKIDKRFRNTDILWSHICFVNDEQGDRTGVCQLFEPVDLSQFLEFSSTIRTLIDKFPLPVALLIEGRITMTNWAYAELIGYGSPEEMIGLPPGTFIHDADRARFDKINADGQINMESGQVYSWRYRIRDGSFKFVEERPVVFPWGDRQAVLSTVTDVTGSMLRQEALQQEYALLEKENALLLEQVSQQHSLLLGQSQNMKQTMIKALRLAKSDNNLVIQGETGTGKSLLARIIHDASPRKLAPFIVVNCAAIPEQLLESAFFGHKRGAFTGAHQDKQGFLGVANKGTLFLDEVGELSLNMQAKLLHALETRQYTPLGAHTPCRVDIRLICATNRDLKHMKETGTLREDFFYRIFVVDLMIPPLRERKGDLSMLAEFFFKKFSALDSELSLSQDMLTLIQEYNWPGNVRELQNVILRYIATGTMELFVDGKDGHIVAHELINTNYFNMNQAVRELEIAYFQKALQASGGNKAGAAKLLGLNVRTFHRQYALLKNDLNIPNEV